MDTLFIKRLCVPTMIGVYTQERQQDQALQFDIELMINPPDTDCINNTVNYAAVREALITWIQQTDYQLIETLAEYLAKQLLRDFPVQKVRLTVYKKPFDIRDADEVGITIERTAPDIQP